MPVMFLCRLIGSYPEWRFFGSIIGVCFKNVVIVADRYHAIRQVYRAMERVRKNEQNKLSARFRKYFKKPKSC